MVTHSRVELMFCQWENWNGPNGIMQRKCQQQVLFLLGVKIWGPPEYVFFWMAYHYKSSCKTTPWSWRHDTVQTQRAVSGHNSTISSQPKCVNQLFILFVMCPDTMADFLASKNMWIGICTVLTWRNVSGHNPTISNHPQCVNQVFLQFWLRGLCLETIPQFLASQNVWIGYLQMPNSEDCVWIQFQNF